MLPENSPLGRQSAYIEHYQPELLFPILRKIKRDEINVPAELPFYGYDLWNAYEVSWLNTKGKPIVAIATISLPANSPYLIESKSLKLYFNSFNQTQFTHLTSVENTIAADLSHATQSHVTVQLTPLHLAHTHQSIHSLPGICLDDLDITIDNYQLYSPNLSIEKKTTTETLHSHLLKSNCLVTGQPDWGSVIIFYSGNKINHESLLKYLIGFRQHNEFHEQCVERIFMDIQRTCKPTKLTVYARYTRRGGIDINPYRSSEKNYTISNPRLVRQ